MNSTNTDLFYIMYHCRAMRRLDTKPVPEDLLIKLVDAGNQAPSGSNMQGARWVVVRDADQKAELAKLNKASVEVYAGITSSRQASLPHQSADKRTRMLNSVLWQAEHMQEIPALIIACYEFEQPVNNAAAAAGSIWPGIQNVLLAARALGLGAAPTTLGLNPRDKVKEILNLPDTVEPVCLIPVGYPLGNFGPVTRLPVEQTMHWDKWGS